jgi:DNA helicase HerA-like ATPase
MKFGHASQPPGLRLGSIGGGWRRQPLIIPRAQITTHGHVIGVSGSGKSRFLAALYLTLLHNGLPATLVDPHGDLARLVLSYLVAGGVYDRPEAFERILYLDLPAAERAGLCLPFNILQTPGSPTTIAGNVLDTFHRTWPALADGAAPRFDKLVTRGIKV